MWNKLLDIDENKYEELKNLVRFKSEYQKIKCEKDKKNSKYRYCLIEETKYINERNLVIFLDDYNKWKDETNKKLDEIEKYTGLIGENIIKYLRPGLIFEHRLDYFLSTISNYMLCREKWSIAASVYTHLWKDNIISYYNPVQVYSNFIIRINIDKKTKIIVSPFHMLTPEYKILTKFVISQTDKNSVKEKYWDVIKDKITNNFDQIYISYIKAYRAYKKYNSQILSNL